MAPDFFINIFYLKQKHKRKTCSVFKYFQVSSISSELVEKFLKKSMELKWHIYEVKKSVEKLSQGSLFIS